MKSLLLFFLTVLLVSQIFADDIYLKNGKVIADVVYKSEANNYYIYNTYPDGQPGKVLKDDVYKIEKHSLSYMNRTHEETYEIPAHLKEQFAKYTQSNLPADPCNSKVLKDLESRDSLSNSEMKLYMQLTKQCMEASKIKANTQIAIERPRSYPYVFFLPLAVVAGIASYNAFDDASDYSDAISLGKKFNVNTSELEGKKSDKIALGVVTGLIGVGLAILSVQSVEVSASPAQVTLNYRYNF